MMHRLISRIALFLALCLVASFSAHAGVENEYVLGAGDIIKISVFQNPDMTVETRVSEAGTVTYPLIGSVPVGGITLAEAESRVAAKLRDGGFVLQPQVNVMILQVRGNQVSVLGQVNRPGRYPLEVASKVGDVLASAGGITPLGSDIVILTGIRNGKPVRMELDVPSLFMDQKGRDVTVQGGDMLYVHRAPQFYIYGEVQRPGVYRIERGMTVMQALAQGGGVTMRGTQRGIRINRRNDDGKLERVPTEMDDAIRADDVIYVPESFF